jgi:glucose-1-phosphate adenylyltransferase
MDFREMLRTHRDAKADVTIAVLPVAHDQASRFGIVQLNDRRQIVNLVEKPRPGEQLAALRTAPDWLRKNGIEANGREYLANMGIYLFNREVLFDLLHGQPLAKDLVTEIFARRLTTHPIQTHIFDGYWADVGTIKSYFEASLDLAADRPPSSFHTPEGVIFTRMRNLPASRLESASTAQCLVSDGCTVSAGSHLERCVIGLRSRIGKNVTLRDVIVNGADRFETPAEREANRNGGLPDFGIGDNTVIERAILDKDCRIGKNVRILKAGRVQEADGPNYAIRDGIVVIPNDALVPDGTTI